MCSKIVPFFCIISATLLTLITYFKQKHQSLKSLFPRQEHLSAT